MYDFNSVLNVHNTALRISSKSVFITSLMSLFAGPVLFQVSAVEGADESYELQNR